MYDKNLSFRFGVLYALLGAVAVVAVAFGIYGAVHPKAPVTKAEVAKAVSAVAGEQNLYALCEASITQTVQQNAGTVQSLKHVSVKTKGNSATVVVELASDIYSGRLTCRLTKSNWQITGIQ
jgi:uncharacterized BrkB/YihY/UPF0761 family membrane protein